MKIIEVNTENVHVYYNLCQSYEGEFSEITKKVPDKNGIFELDTIIGENVIGYLLYNNSNPIGFVAVKIKNKTEYEVCEFYIVPSMRGKNIGGDFAKEVFSKHKGYWEVKQIEGATKAVKFWRKTITEFTNNNFKEDIYQDNYWGKVTRQIFSSN